MAITVAVGCVLGFLSGIGIGGGSLLMLWLTLVIGMEPFPARCINLLFFIPCALCASFFRWRQGHLKIRKILLPMVLGCIAAAGFSLLSQFLDTSVLRKMFGVLLIFTGIRELFYRPKKLSSASEN